MSEFAAQLKSWRISRGMSQTELALKAGIPRPNLIDIETGKRDCTLGTLRLLAKALDVTPGKFLDEFPPTFKTLDRYEIDVLARSYFEIDRKLSSHFKFLQQALWTLISPIVKSVGVKPIFKKRPIYVKYSKLQGEALLGKKQLERFVVRVNKLAERY